MERVVPCMLDNVLHEQHGVVFRACGLRLDGGTYDNLTLDVVRERERETGRGD